MRRSKIGMVVLVGCFGLAGCASDALDSDETADVAGTSTEQSDAGDDSGSDTGGVTDGSGTTDGSDSSSDPSCPQADIFLDVSLAAGPGEGYPEPELEVACEGDEVVVTGNNIPHYTFIAMTPNGLTAQNSEYRFPREPVYSETTSEIPLLGAAGVAANGLPVNGANEAEFPDPYGDPIVNAILDGCMGHVGQDYHYHALYVKCMTEASLVAEPWDNEDPDPSIPSPVIGYAFDGFPIYGPHGCLDASCEQVVEFKSGWDNIGFESIGCSSSSECSNGYVCAWVMIEGDETMACAPTTYAWDNNVYVAKSDETYLDECNGRMGPDGTYRYHTTSTFPYALGCYHGQATSNVGGGGGGGGGGGPGGGQGGGPGGGGGTPPDCEEGQTQMCCGDGVCDGPETADNCPADCG